MSRQALTIVVPLFNGRPFLDLLLPSLKAQQDSVERYLFIDDASTDGSLDHVRGVGLPRCDYVANETNLGLYATLNRALAMVKTELVALVFQDDALLGDYAAQMRDLARRRPDANFFTAGFARIDADGAAIHTGGHGRRMDQDAGRNVLARRAAERHILDHQRLDVADRRPGRLRVSA
jgi:glycosyltransferase involved in cell wall biosynthesis